MKRFRRLLALALCLALGLTLLPTTVRAGGGGGSRIWDCEFESPNDGDRWTVIDANGDGLGFYLTSESEAVPGNHVMKAPVQLSSGTATTVKRSDEYLISESIKLTDDWENVVDFKFNGNSTQTQFIHFDVFVVDAGVELTALSLTSLLTDPIYHGVAYSYEDWQSDRFDLTAFEGRQIRLVFRFYCDNYATLSFDDIYVYAMEPDEYLADVTAMNLPEPQIGLSVGAISESVISFPEFANYTLVPGSLIYMRTVDESAIPMDPEETFEANVEYTAKFTVRPKEGITVLESGKASVNGKWAVFNARTDGTVDIYRGFGILKPLKLEVSQIHLFNLDPPVPDGTPDRDADRWLPYGDTSYGYYVEDILWDPGDNPFKPNVAYSLNVKIRLYDGWTLAEYPHATINGEPVIASPQEDGSVTLIKRYGRTRLFPPTNYYTQQPWGGRCLIGDPFMTEVSFEYAPTAMYVMADLDCNGSFETQVYQIMTRPFELPYRSEYAGKRISFVVRPEFDDTSLETGDSHVFTVHYMQPLPTANVTVTAPKAGQTPDINGVSDEPYDYMVEQVTWHKVEDDGSESLPVTTPFLENAIYRVRVLLDPDSYYTFSDSSKVTINGKSAKLEWVGEDGEGLYTADFSTSPPSAHTVTFNTNGFGKAPAPVTVPAGSTLYDTLKDTGKQDDYDLPDVPGFHFYGWSTSSDNDRSLDYDDCQTLDEDVTLYAIYAEVIGLVEFCVQAPDAGVTATPPKAYVPLYMTDNSVSDYTIDPAGWWESQDAIEHGEVFSGIFEAGKTYYAGFNLQPDRHHCFEDGLIVIPYGASLVSQDYWEPFYRIVVAVTIPAPGALSSIELRTDGIRAGMPTSMKAELNSLTSGVIVDFDSYWWQDPEDVDEVMSYEGFLEPGRTFYSEATLHVESIYTIPDNVRITVNGEDAVAIEKTALENTIRIIFAAKVPDAHELQVRVTPAGSGQIRSEDLGWSDVIDAPFFAAASHYMQARPSDGWHFKGWYLEDGTKLSTEAVWLYTSDRDGVILAVFEEGPEPPIEQENPFLDVVLGEYYYDPVLWAYYHDPQITTGTDERYYSPEEGCTRAQVVTFLWRANGKPPVEGVDNPFKDVVKGEYYYDAVLWAVKNGITTGTEPDLFSPDETCTRAQIVTFLWRYEGKPAPGTAENPFKDVAKGEYYYDAVLWAVGKGVTTGTEPDRFSPNETCTRAQIVTFLYRDMK